jgi:TPP-dependent 2-oxoacid decarboxylase
MSLTDKHHAIHQRKKEKKKLKEERNKAMQTRVNERRYDRETKHIVEEDDTVFHSVGDFFFCRNCLEMFDQ